MADGMRSTKDINENKVAGQPDSGTAAKQRLVVEERAKREGREVKSERDYSKPQSHEDRKKELDEVNKQAEADRAQQIKEEGKRRDNLMKDIKTTDDDPRHDPMWQGSPDNRAEVAAGGHDLEGRAPVIVMGRHIGHADEKWTEVEPGVVRYSNFTPIQPLDSYLAGDTDLTIDYNQGWLLRHDIPERNRQEVYRRDLIEVLDEVKRY